MRRRSKWLSLLLAASIIVGSTGSVYADETIEAASEVSVEETTVEVEQQIETEQETETVDEPVVDDVSMTEGEDAEEETPSPSVQLEDHGDGTIDLSLNDYVKADDIVTLYYAVWSQKDAQDDIKWYVADSENKYQMNTRDHNDDLGQYIVHVYERNTAGNMNLVVASTFDVSSIERGEPTLSAVDVNGDEKKFRITLANYEKTADGKAVQIAVWSKEKGQDDIAWYTMKENADGTYSYDVNPSKFKHDGEFFVHTYGQSTSGKMTYIGSTGFSVTAPASSGILVEEIDSDKGTCKVTVSGITCPSGVTKVQIPVWSMSDQSDIYWYAAEKVSDDSYAATIDISNHKFNVGPFIIHGYVTSGNGFTSYVGNSSVKFEVADPIVTVSKKDGKYLLGTANIAMNNVKGVTYAVWSQNNGQDDIKWYSGTYTAATRSGQYLMSMSDFKDTGKYFVHCYANLSDGSMKYLGATSFEIAPLAIEGVDITTDPDTGDFKITVKGLKSEAGIDKVQIPVWSKSNQSDIVWYTAKKDSTGNYVVSSNVSKHSYNSGTYQAHVYVTEKNGMCSNVARESFDVKLSAAIIKVSGGSDQITYTATANGVKLPGGVKGLQFAVWSQKNGQDDIKWYDATKVSDGNYKASISIKNHKTNGLYYVHVYAENSAGKKVNVGTTEFTVNTTSTASMTFTDSSSYDGFSIAVTLTGATCAVSKVKVPVWSKSDQSDINWYTVNATSAGDGTYTAVVNVKAANHNYNTGKYTAHCYAVYKNGIEGFAGGTNYSYNPPYVLGVTKTGNGTRNASLRYASSVSGVKFAVWSDDKGQDDIKWYNASKQSDGSWSATIKSVNHKSSGNYQVHCYDGNNNFLGATTFSFAASEMVKQGWYYENGYKFYYKDGKKLTNLTSIIGAQGSYVAKVNRTTCTITIYANDPDSSKGYIIPVIAFTCSVGLPATPTTAGTHYTFAKYRWKELMGPSWGQYATKFTADGIYFHSVAGVNTTSYNLNYIDYNNLGIPASHGCVRLCVRDAKWIYDNCPLGMKVIVYDSGDPGPYGKPATIKIPAGQTWDPTDPNIY